MSRLAAVCVIAWSMGCGSSAKGPTDAAPETGNDQSCPAQQPKDGDACTGTSHCGYGHATCCGVSSTANTCVCQQGHFSCSMTVECNFVCPDASPGEQ
jgi:hypothetical protein